MNLLIITTGGTIGALPYEDPRRPVSRSVFSADGRNPVLDTLPQASPAFAGIRRMALEPRDSKDIDDAYLEKLTALIAAAPEQAVLVTHGTDRLLESAAFLYRQIAAPALENRMILLTGAMIPLLNGPESDGFANLEFALEQLAEFSGTGLYIVLCDYTDQGAWRPQLYRFEPGLYEKIHGDDARFSHIRKRQA